MAPPLGFLIFGRYHQVPLPSALGEGGVGGVWEGCAWWLVAGEGPAASAMAAVPGGGARRCLQEHGPVGHVSVAHLCRSVHEDSEVAEVGQSLKPNLPPWLVDTSTFRLTVWPGE